MNPIDDFWQRTAGERLEAHYAADRYLTRLSAANPQQLEQILVQYRFFTGSFASDLAVVVARAPYGRFKSLMASILHEELGSGDEGGSHLELYDAFLRSLGVDRDLDGAGDVGVLAMFEELQRLTAYAPFGYAVGLRGMGGECLCQVYLSVMERRLRENPWVEASLPRLDWRFWDIHAGEEDEAHRLATRAAIAGLVERDPSLMPHLEAGWCHAKAVWDDFWTRMHRQAWGEAA